MKHIVEYYYRARRHPLPQLPVEVRIDPTRQPRSNKEILIREMICHHMACDGVHFTTIYDSCSLLSHEDPTDRPYLAVLENCAFRLRQNFEVFYPDGSLGDPTNALD